jgi:hypothetical protein
LFRELDTASHPIDLAAPDCAPLCGTLLIYTSRSGDEPKP